jgi:hypothetical protein
MKTSRTYAVEICLHFLISDLNLKRCFVLQNPYMKEKFVLIIESFHVADRGQQDNVSHMV